MIAIVVKLTSKQEKFVQNLLKGLSQTDAYKKAYNTSKMKEKTIIEKASVLANKDNIRTRYEELNKRAEDKAIMSAIERKKWLTKVINCDVKVKQEYDNEIKEYDPYMSDRLKALDMLNKMDGVYVTKLNGDINVNKKLEDMI